MAVVFTNRSRRIVAVFIHASDAAEFEDRNARYGYSRRDEPELDAPLAQWMNAPLVDETWRDPKRSG
jgi:hypothetical protein